jgi:hypothetical protein
VVGLVARYTSNFLYLSTSHEINPVDWDKLYQQGLVAGFKYWRAFVLIKNKAMLWVMVDNVGIHFSAFQPTWVVLRDVFAVSLISPTL